MKHPVHTRLRIALRRLRRNASGMALVEFALIGPIFLVAGFSAMELANMSVTVMRISQIGMNAGDNIARVGSNAGTSLQRLLESDIEDTFLGMQMQGSPINFAQRGRIIVSGLQRNASGGQWIAWQRCFGAKSAVSNYGTAGTGRTVNTYAGMGPAGQEVTAPSANDSVIFVEVIYDYEPIFEPFVRGLTSAGVKINSAPVRFEQAYVVRNPRELGDSTQTAPTATEDYGLFQDSPTATTRRTLPGSGANPDYSNNC